MRNKLPNVNDSVRYDSETDVYAATFDAATTRPSIAIVEAIASVRDQDPTDLDPLSDVIDLEAVDDLLLTSIDSPDTGDRKVEFQFREYGVTILSYGVVKVRPLADGGNAGTN